MIKHDMTEEEFKAMIAKELAAAQARGLTPSQFYLQRVRDKSKKVEAQIPYLWKAIMNRKYLIPEYRQKDYVNQDVYSYLMLDHIIGAGKGRTAQPHMTDEVMRTHYISYLRQIECDRPIYFLERELARPMMNTKLPDDFLVSDINWRWPCFRVYLPKGTLTLERDGYVNNMVYLDILQIKAHEKYTLPEEMKVDLWTLGAFKNPSYENDLDGLAVSGVIDLDDHESALGFTGSTPLDGMTIKRIRESEGQDLNKNFPSDSIDNAFIHKMLMLGLNILIFLSNYPVEYDKDPKKGVVRPPKKEGERTVPGLYQAKFVGAAQLRPKSNTLVSHSGASYTLPAHWKSGHWKRIWYGPKKGQSRLQWIGLYHTGKVEEAGPRPKN